jgi:hypothetical protein
VSGINLPANTNYTFPVTSSGSGPKPLNSTVVLNSGVAGNFSETVTIEVDDPGTNISFVTVGFPSGFTGTKIDIRTNNQLYPDQYVTKNSGAGYWAYVVNLDEQAAAWAAANP